MHPPERYELLEALWLDSIGGRAPSGPLRGDEGRKVRLTQYARSVDHVLPPISLRCK
ncbi:hypothetical protein J2W14_003218 [Pseudarthrobacter oxydans]|uniref:baeRF11 domain-containing protein n=1 Tax=Pseudarthrobacter oxydans TaxID=1671 RepID=UPI0027849692|nr:hypothetical protein [Pseudarthrobacter oxydans]MDP9983795.1 hypothetical protein [Pseudarthrobacter oxydans]